MRDRFHYGLNELTGNVKIKRHQETAREVAVRGVLRVVGMVTATR